MTKKKKLKKDEFEVEVVDKFDEKEFFDDCPICQAMKSAQKEGKELSSEELKEAFQKAKEQGAIVGGSLIDEMEDEELEEIGSADNFQMPKWMECTWRRVPCGKDDCPICGRIKRDRQRHIGQGEDPDDIKSVFEDVGQNFKEALEMIKKDCEARGIELTNIDNIKEPPEPETFPFYQDVKKWRDSVFTLADNPVFEFWTHTEPAQDLFWYSNTLTAKVYRQLCNKWKIENGNEYGDFDYQYTKYVLEECLRIFKKSLRELIVNNQSQKESLNLIFTKLIELEKKIRKI